MLIASQNGHEAVIKLLLAAGANVNKALDVSHISWSLGCYLV